MAKDPAFLFYSSDFMTGTVFFTNEQVGKYMRLLCIQHQKGHLTKQHMLQICESYDKDIFEKFIQDENGLYYNERCEYEILKRKRFSESRSNNRKKSITSKSYEKHMENENENTNNKKEEFENLEISDYMEKRKEVFENLPRETFDKLKKYNITEPIIFIGKKVPVIYYDLSEIFIEAINSDEWKLNMKHRFQNVKFDEALKGFISTLKTNYEYQTYEGVNDFKRHFSNWLNKNQSSYAR